MALLHDWPSRSALRPKNSMASYSQPRNVRLLVFVVLASAAIYAADLLLSQGFAVGAAYVAWLLISFWLPGRQSTIVMAAVATSLIVVAFFLNRAEGTSMLVDAGNRAFATVAVWIAAALIVLRKRTETRRGRTEARRRAFLRALGEEPEALDEPATGHLVSVQEQERSRLARELHDDYIPHLAIAAMEIQASLADPSKAAERSRSVAGQLKKLEEGLRRFCARLYPTALDRLDLAEAIESECLSFEEQFGVWVDFESRNVPRTLPKEAAVCLYRVCQEGLNNVARHSKAGEAKVLLEASDDGLTLVVSDSGVGFDPQATTGSKGLLGMRERARLAGGRLEVRSRRGAGTEIVAFVPVAWTDEGLAVAAGA